MVARLVPKSFQGGIIMKNKSDLDKLYDELRSYNTQKNKEAHELRDFFLGLIMFGAGLFMILQNAQVRSTLGYGGYFYHIGSWGVPNGLVMLPLVFGILLLFMLDKKLPGWIVTVLGIIFILLTILMNTRLEWKTTNAYMFILMFGLVAAGGGLMLRILFKSK